MLTKMYLKTAVSATLPPHATLFWLPSTPFIWLSTRLVLLVSPLLSMSCVERSQTHRKETRSSNITVVYLIFVRPVHLTVWKPISYPYWLYSKLLSVNKWTDVPNITSSLWQVWLNLCPWAVKLNNIIIMQPICSICFMTTVW